MTTFYLVQHGEKSSGAGDPGLSALGAEQARHTATYLRGERIERLFASRLRRASETARVLADTLDLPLHHDDRLRERMNWGAGPEPQTLEAFLADWARATADRTFQPPSGDSSHAAGARLLALLDELSERYAGERVALVTHGGVTLDALRNLFSDAHLDRSHPTVRANGPHGCAITRLVRRFGGYDLDMLASVAHLPEAARTPHRA